MVAAIVTVYWAASPSGPVGGTAVSGAAVGRSAAAVGSAGPSGSAGVGVTADPSRSGRPSPSSAPASGAGGQTTRPSARTSAKATTATTAGGTAPTGSQRGITLVNHTQQTIWAVVSNTSLYPDGRKLAPGQSTSLTVGNSWGGRIWGRTGCTTDAHGSCLTGDCTTSCSGPTTPTTLGEFTFNAFDGMDFYDVSMVDGANLPMYINISHTVTTDPVSAAGCYKGSCTRPVVCPSAMQAVNGGQVIGCKPPCAAFGGDTYCCRGAWAGRDNCVPAKWPVDYTQVFKKAEPYAYSYAFDDSATMACKGQCSYRVTFGTTG
ncbi:thaumatin family protein [Streptacidiphilus cavernicola]|uniref:Thaumatin family protein n=1 Tax=Streptacidiphilus cavernicola TaxID=3342716 RepID=A0ABV6VWJ9_9ACTN